jgi:hypothetical protein
MDPASKAKVHHQRATPESKNDEDEKIQSVVFEARSPMKGTAIPATSHKDTGHVPQTHQLSHGPEQQS